MKFQLALDAFELDEAVKIAKDLGDLIQVLEIGTPLVLKEGRNAIRELRKHFPSHDILADYKMMDAGDVEAHIAFEAGASIVTVCGAANLATINNALRQARADGGKVMIDMIEVQNLRERLSQLDGLGADYIQIHTAFDGRGDKSPLQELAVAKSVLKNTPIAVAGGVGLHNIEAIAAMEPVLVVLGSRVLSCGNPRAELEKIHEAVGGGRA